MPDQPQMSEDYAKGLRWFSRHEFSLIPQWRYRAADKWNASSFYIHWLNVQFWTNIAPQIGVEISIQDHGGFLRFHLPYSHLSFQFLWIPKCLQHVGWLHGTGEDK